MARDGAAAKADLCVIGAGSGGLSVAAGAAMLGRKVVLVEAHKMGGDCLNYGCVPSKSLIAAARTAHAVRHARRFGIGAGVPQADGAGVAAHIRGVIAAIEPNDSAERFRGLGVDVIAARARFTDPRTIEAGGRRIRARRFVLATGSRPLVPPIPGLADTPYFTNETVFDLETVPTHLIVLGGGPVGMEMAQAWRRLGAEVTLLEAARVLGKDDPELARIVAAALIREGVVIREGARAVAAARAGDGVEVVYETAAGTARVRGSHLLVALGRRANVEELGLDIAGVKTGPAGIAVNRSLRTTNRRIYAIGDCAGGPQFTHAASYHAGLVIRNALFRLPVRADHGAIPWATFTDPELAQAGLGEEAARAKYGDIRVLRWPLAENDRAQTERCTDGLIKIFATKAGRVAGAAIAAPHAGELILPWILAIARNMRLSAFASAVVPYPTYGEISKRAAASYYTPALFSARSRALVRFLALFG